MQFKNGRSFYLIYSQYVSLRKEPVPFSWESVVCWILASYLLECYSSSRDCLELGVENGGTAFLSLLTLQEDDILYLVDQKQTIVFKQVYEKLSDIQRGNINFIVDKTNGDKTNVLLDRAYRSIHIDAGHLYHEVLADLEKYYPCLADDGVLIMDDMFQGRWPEVTEALYSFFKKYEPDISPFLIAFNKVYFCKQSHHNSYLISLENIASVILEKFGKFTLIQTKMLGISCFYVRGSVDSSKRGKSLSDY